MTPQEIQALIQAGLPGAAATVTSADHVHFEATVVSAAFEGLRPIARHRLVYGAIGPAVGGDIHALAIQAYTPAEWQARGG
jgi:acid stress-induced BolA-like protein IbaG/YrbA